jgi:hypothetical protein
MRFGQPSTLAFLYVGFASALVALSHATTATGASITTADIVAIPENAVGSGNGTLDLHLFTFSGSEIGNQAGSFNGDNGNNTLPNSGGTDTNTFTESYVTTAGDLKAFFNTNFAPNTINQVVLFLDLNETAGGSSSNTLAKLDIILNPATIQGSPNPVGDVTSDQQAAIDHVFTGGTLAANLVPEPALNIPANNQGAGFADYAIYTHINPFTLADSDVLLFNVSMNTLSNGSEGIFLSGNYKPSEVPEPASIAAIGLVGAATLARRRRA